MPKENKVQFFQRFFTETLSGCPRRFRLDFKEEILFYLLVAVASKFAPYTDKVLHATANFGQRIFAKEKSSVKIAKLEKVAS